MIYLDYSATTKTSENVLNRFMLTSSKCFFNANSAYSSSENKIIDESNENILNTLNIKNSEVIYTSGASEANNTIIKGICDKYEKGHIITTPYEHSSVLAPLSYLQSKGFKVSFTPLDENGCVDLNQLESLITEDTVLVTIVSVNSETGIRNPIEQIGKLLKKYSNITFHTDATQAIGKTNIDFTDVDAVSLSSHKFFGIVGIGALIVKNDVKFTPLIHGGKSTTMHRSGTPQLALIDSMSCALTNAYNNFDSKITYVNMLNKKIKTHLNKYKNIYINSNDKCIGQIINISIPKYKSTQIQNYFTSKDIYISTQTACTYSQDYSKTILTLTNDLERASSSIRISLSYETTMDEIDVFLKELDELMR